MKSDQTIFEYTIPVGKETEVSLAADFKVLTVALDGTGIPTVWVQQSYEADTVDLIFFWVGTGHILPADSIYAGSIMQRANLIMQHLFYRRKV